MATTTPQKQRGWLNKSEMAASLGISVQAFDKWGVQPVERIGREAFYTAQSVVENRVALNTQKRQPDYDEEGVDPLAEQKLLQERIRLISAQADTQETKNQINERQLVPVGVAVFVFSKIAPRFRSRLDMVPLKLRRIHPDMDPRHLDSLQRELAIAGNDIAEFADSVTDYVDEYYETLAD